MIIEFKYNGETILEFQNTSNNYSIGDILIFEYKEILKNKMIYNKFNLDFFKENSEIILSDETKQIIFNHYGFMEEKLLFNIELPLKK